MDSILRAWLAALPDNPALFTEMVRSVSIEDWPSLLDRIAAHSLLSILVPYLEGASLPPQVWPTVIRRNAVLMAMQEPLIRSLETTVSSLRQAGVRVCVLKGPVLSARLYGDPAARGSTDLDLLMPPHELDRAISVMRALGYVGKSEATAAYLLRHSHHLHFAKSGATPIELHFQAYAGFGVTVPSSALMDRAVEYRFTDHTTVFVPSPEDEFMYLAVHVSGHSFARLIWLYDLKMLLQKNPQLDWDLVVNRSREAHISTAVGFAVKLLMEWLDVPLQHLIGRFPRRSIRLSTADLLLPMASRAASFSAVDNLKGLVFTAMLCDGPLSTLWLLQHHVFRSVRRRAQRAVPQLLPESWSG